MADNSFKINRGVNLSPQNSVPSNPTDGDLYYDASSDTYSFYNNGFWINLASRADVASAASLTSADFTALVVQNSFARITGSTAASLHGVTASTDAKMLILYNQSSQILTVKHQSGSEATAANRIISFTGADITISSGGSVFLVYDNSQSRWITISSGSGSAFDSNTILTGGGQPIVTEWGSEAWTPTGSWTSNATYTGKFRRVGDTMEAMVDITLSGAPTAAGLTINLPGTYTINSSKLVSVVAQPFGEVNFTDDSVPDRYIGAVIFGASTSLVAIEYHIVSGSLIKETQISNSAPITFAANDVLRIKFRVPITGWAAMSSGGEVLVNNDGNVLIA